MIHFLLARGPGCQQAPAAHTGHWMHTRHPATPLPRDLPLSGRGGVTNLFAWSRAPQEAERSTALCAQRGTSARRALRCAWPWPHACPLPPHHDHILLLGHPPSHCPQTVKAARATALLRGCLLTGTAVQAPAGSRLQTSPVRCRRGQSEQLCSAPRTKPCPQQASEQGVNG